MLIVGTPILTVWSFFCCCLSLIKVNSLSLHLELWQHFRNNLFPDSVFFIGNASLHFFYFWLSDLRRADATYYIESLWRHGLVILLRVNGIWHFTLDKCRLSDQVSGFLKWDLDLSAENISGLCLAWNLGKCTQRETEKN